MYDILSLLSENVSKSNHKLKKRRAKNLQVNLFYGQKTTQTSSLDHTNIIIEELKSPKLCRTDFTEPFIVHCDASEKGLEAVLYQEIDGKMKVISYASRTLTPAEKNYHLHHGKLEFLALKWFVTEKCQDYLYYAIEFTVYSDNNPLL